MENKQKVFRKVYVKDRLPGNQRMVTIFHHILGFHEVYHDSNGIFYKSRGCKLEVNYVTYWIEEIELPSDEFEPIKAEEGTSMWWHDKGFENGFRACLNMIQHDTNR